MPEPTTNAAPQGQTDLYAALRRRGLRPNLYRVFILRILEAAAGAMAADEVFREASAAGVDISQGTIYRVLRELEQGGFVVRDRGTGPFDDKHRYWIAHGGPVRGNDVFVCSGCATEVVVTDAHFRASLARAAQLAGFDRGGAGARIVMTCGHCARRSAGRYAAADVTA